MSFTKFEGTPCFEHTKYVFYKSFKFNVNGKPSVLSLGDFFFLKILQDIPICIGEIQLLWEDKESNNLLSSLKLYFLPEHTPDGRQEDSGEDEVVVLGERMVLRLDDLVPLIQQDVTWSYGSTAVCPRQQPCQEGGVDAANAANGDVAKADTKDCVKSLLSNGSANVAVMSYPKYCRYRAVMKRLEGCENQWLHVALVMAIGGFPARAPGCRVMFCKDSFYNTDIDDLECRMDHLFPVLKKKIKKIKIPRKDSVHDSDSTEELFSKVAPSISSSSRPRRSAEQADMGEDSVNTEEQTFLFGLHKFMHDSKMPIGRIPSLGFKQIDLYYFYKQAEKIGGYDAITTKRMWKHLYDKLGGNSSNTSAATCTRRHYERLLLPYEKQLRKLKGPKPKRKHKHKDKQTAASSVKKDEVKEVSDSSSHKENIELNLKDIKKKNTEDDIKIDVKREKFGENVTNMAVPLAPGPVKDAPQAPSERAPPPEAPSVTSRIQQDIKPSVQVLKQEIKPATSPALAHPSVKPHPVRDARDIPKVQHLEAVQPNHAKPPTSLVTPAPTPLASASPLDTQNIPYGNLVYRGGYLMPVLPQNMISPWGVITSHGPAATDSNNPIILKDTPPTTPTGRPRQALTSAVTPSVLAPTSKRSRGLVSPAAQPSSFHKPLVSAHASQPNRLHQQNQSVEQPRNAHSKALQPSPYHLTDHIHQLRGAAPSSLYRQPAPRMTHPNDLLGVSSHNLAPLLHPTPPGHRNPPSLPRAPSTMYLDPTNTNPFNPQPQPLTKSPPRAHVNPHKRGYPFVDEIISPSAFPSPDMVLSSIKSSAGLPGHSAALKASSIKQEFEDPRAIFKQTTKIIPVSQAFNPSPIRKQNPQVLHQGSNSRLVNQKSPKTAPSVPSIPQGKRSNSQLFPHYTSNHGQSQSAQQKPVHIQQLASNSNNISLATASGSTKRSDPSKSVHASSIGNGFLHIPHQGPQMMLSNQQVAALASGKDPGRLTSALFGAQFTAHPRPSNSSDSALVSKESSSSKSIALTSSSSSSQVAAALGLNPLNPQLHPAFMASYLPTSSSTATSLTASTVAATSLTPQQLMLASAYGAPNMSQLSSLPQLSSLASLPQMSQLSSLPQMSQLSSLPQMSQLSSLPQVSQLAAYEELLRQSGYGMYMQGLQRGPTPAKQAKNN